MSSPPRTISSQRYADPEIVEGKRRARDYTCQRVEIVVDGERLHVVVDGHHSLSAARLDCQEIAWETPSAIQIDANSAMEQGAQAVADWMATMQGESDWYDIANGRDAW